MNPTIISQPGEYRYKLTEAGEQEFVILQLPDQIGDLTVDIQLNHEGAKATVGVLVIGVGDTEKTLTCHLHHTIAGTQANLTARAILKDSARATFNGLIKIDEGAGSTESFLEHRSLLLSDDCQSNPIPSLEIAADDVRASHAATISNLNEEDLFYLQSRGLTETAARDILIDAFVEDQVGSLPRSWQTKIKHYLHS